VRRWTIEEGNQMKQYLLSVYHPESDPLEPEVMEKITSDVNALNVELQQAGAWVFAGGLYPWPS
jgi:hypothetical protein